MEKKSNSLMLKLAILTIAFVSQSNTVASVLMADIARSFPDASQTAIQYVMQFGMIGAFPLSLVAGFLANKIRKKQLCLVGIGMIIVGGAIPIINHSALLILYAGALIVGAGQGLVMPLISALIVENFRGGEQNAMLGFNSAVCNGGSTLLLLLAGVIAKTGWINVYFLYFISIPALLFVLIFLPKGELPKSEPSADGAAKSKAPVPWQGWVQSILGTVFFLFYVTFSLNISMYLDATGLGDAVAASISMSLVTCFGIVAGLMFKPLAKVFKFYMVVFFALSSVIGFALMIFAQNVIMIYAAAMFLGLTFGLSGASGAYIVSRVCKPEQVGPTFSIINAMMTLGIVLSPMIINPIASRVNGGGAKGSFTVAFIAIIVMTVVYFFWASFLTRTVREPVEAAK